MSLDLSNIQQVVQTNCHIADANAAGNYTLCIYLLKMREFYRWESGYNYGDNIPRAEVGSWLREREELWESLQEKDFAKIPIEGELYDPFDSDAINSTLAPKHLVYSGGFGRDTQAHFFLGVLERHEHHHGFDIIVVADEYARDLTAPPAMSQGNKIYIRREAMHRMIWEKYEQLLWNTPKNALGRALAFYDFEHNLDAALQQMTDNELNAAVLHEIGEVNAHQVLGGDWEKLLLASAHSKLELLLRAIRDHFADCVSTLPALVEQNNIASLHFYIANLNNMRKSLFPAIISAYDQWRDSNDSRYILDIAQQGQQHWQQLCLDCLAHYQQHDNINQDELISLIENNKL